MIIRDATITDINSIVGLTKEYAHETPLDCATQGLSPQKLATIIKESIGLGLAKIALNTESSEIIGFIFGIVALNVWSNHAHEINMMAIYVKPEHRKGTTGGRLFKSYMKTADKLMDERPEILMNNVFKLPEGTNIDFEKRGFKPIQVQYSKER